MAFIYGCFVGATFGVLALALCRSAASADRGMRERGETSTNRVA